MAFYLIFSKERSQSQMSVATPNTSQTEQLIFKHESPHVWRQIHS